MTVSNKTRYGLSGGLFLLLFAMNSYADSDPVYTSNQNPLVMSYGIPAPEPARLLARGLISGGVFLQVSSLATEASNSDEILSLDGEIYRLNFRVRYGWRDRWQLGMDISALRHEGGHLDNFVENWHDWFGLPNGDRGSQPQDRLLYRYQKGDQVLLHQSDATSGLGDLRLSARYQLRNTNNYQLSIGGGIKLPTGDEEKLTGSGSTDTYLELATSLVPDLEHKSITLHSGLGILHTSTGDLLNSIKEDWIPYAYATAAWGVTNSINLKLQLNGHGSIYDSRLDELNDAAIELVMGGTITLSKNLLLDLSMSEDIIGDSPPDFTMQLGLRYRLPNSPN